MKRALQQHEQRVAAAARERERTLQQNLKRQNDTDLKRLTDILEHIAVCFETNDVSERVKDYMQASLSQMTSTFNAAVSFGKSHQDLYRSKLFYKAQEVARRIGARIYRFEEYMYWGPIVDIVFTWNPKDKAIEEKRSWWQRVTLPSQKYYKIALKYIPGETDEGGPPGGPQIEGGPLYT